MKSNNKALIALLVVICGLPLFLIMAGLIIGVMGWGPFLFILVVIVVVSVWSFVAGMRKSLARDLNRCHEAWLGVNAELKRRQDLVPRLVSMAGDHVSREKEVLERVTQAWNAAVASHGPPVSRARDEKALASSLRHLLAVAESYPGLRANEGFLSLQRELAGIEARIQNAQLVYNSNVQEYNSRLQVFPWVMVADFFSFKPREPFVIESPAEVPTAAARAHGLASRQDTLPVEEGPAKSIETVPSPQLVEQARENASPELVEIDEFVLIGTEEPVYGSARPVEETTAGWLPGAAPASRRVTPRTSLPAWPGWPSASAGPNGPSS